MGKVTDLANSMLLGIPNMVGTFRNDMFRKHLGIELPGILAASSPVAYLIDKVEEQITGEETSYFSEEEYEEEEYEEEGSDYE